MPHNNKNREANHLSAFQCKSYIVIIFVNGAARNSNYYCTVLNCFDLKQIATHWRLIFPPTYLPTPFSIDFHTSFSVNLPTPFSIDLPTPFSVDLPTPFSTDLPTPFSPLTSIPLSLNHTCKTNYTTHMIIFFHILFFPFHKSHNHPHYMNMSAKFWRWQ